MHTQLRFEARLHLGFEAKSNQNNPDIRPFPMQTKVRNFSAAHFEITFAYFSAGRTSAVRETLLTQ